MRLSQNSLFTGTNARPGLAMWGALLLAMLVGTGCSSFNRAWRAAEQQPVPPDGLAGRWAGTWRSEPTGHQDELRAIITPASNGVYSARFHARYRKGIFRFSFGYTLPLQAERQGELVRFRGEADLGWLAGGVYRCDGSASGTNFSSTYHSKYDHGVFEMKRPAPVR